MLFTNGAKLAKRAIKRSMRRSWVGSIACCVMGLWCVLGLMPTIAHAQNLARPKRVLVLYWYNMDFPPNVIFQNAFRPVLESAGAGAVEYYAEYLETNRFPEEQNSRALMDYLRRKYADREPDVVVTVGPRVQELISRNRDTLFPRTPVVVVSPVRLTMAEHTQGPGVTGIIIQENHAETIALALRLHPKTEHVYVVSGTLEHDGKFERLARNVLKDYRGRAKISYLTDLSPDSLLAALKALPPRSVVLYVWQQARDRHGRLMETADVLATIAGAPVPIYGLTDWNMGRGIVGGQLFRLEVNAIRAAEIVLQITSGARARGIPFQRAPTVPMFDWRQLQRWGIRESNLPPGSIVLFRDRSMWETHRWQIIGVATFCVVEALLIIGLLVQRAQRRRVQEGLRESERALRVSHGRIEDLAGRLINAQDEERKHIARELHDDLSQQVAALSITISSLKRRVAPEAAATQGQLDYLQEGLIAVSRQIRDMSHELHSTVLQNIGLAGALRQFCEEFTNHRGIEIGLDIQDVPGPMPEDISLCLYRVAQEALHNIAKHSGTRSAEVRLSAAKDHVSLIVTDDGVGFDAAAAGRYRGLGMVSMEERVRLLRGSFQVRSEVGTGTEIRVQIPWGADGEETTSTAS
jgi:signal transduction histidine kinase